MSHANINTLAAIILMGIQISITGPSLAEPVSENSQQQNKMTEMESHHHPATGSTVQGSQDSQHMSNHNTHNNTHSTDNMEHEHDARHETGSGTPVIKTLNRLPSSGKAREAGYDDRYVMEPTAAEESLAILCAKASRGLVMLDNGQWEQCGGKPAGLPAGKSQKKGQNKATLPMQQNHGSHAH